MRALSVWEGAGPEFRAYTSRHGVILSGVWAAAMVPGRLCCLAGICFSADGVNLKTAVYTVVMDYTCHGVQNFVLCV